MKKTYNGIFGFTLVLRIVSKTVFEYSSTHFYQMHFHKIFCIPCLKDTKIAFKFCIKHALRIPGFLSISDFRELGNCFQNFVLILEVDLE